MLQKTSDWHAASAAADLQRTAVFAACRVILGYRKVNGTQQIFYIPVLTLIALVVLIAAGYYLRNLRGKKAKIKEKRDA